MTRPVLGCYEENNAVVIGADTWSIAAWAARIKQLDSDIAVMDDAVNADIKRMLAKQATGATLNDDEQAIVKYIPGFTNFKFDWSAFKASNPWSTDSNGEQLTVFEKRFRQIRSGWDALKASTKPALPVSDLPVPKSDPNVASVTSAIKWVGIAVVTVYGVKLVLDSGIVSSHK